MRPRRLREVWTAPFGVLVLLVVAVAGSGCSTSTPPSAGFWYEDGAFALPDDITSRLGGPLQLDDVLAIKRVSVAELDRAFSGLRITVSERRDAYWRVGVNAILPNPGACRAPANLSASVCLADPAGSGFARLR
jgi:hypothetical protein